MSLIKDIYEIPMSKTVTWILVGVIVTVPSNLIYYYFEPELYLSIDLIKMLILTCGTGLVFFILNFISTFILTILELKREHVITANRDNLLNASLSTTLIVVIITLAGACYTIEPEEDLKSFMEQLGVSQASLITSFILLSLGIRSYNNWRARRKQK